MNKKMLSKIAFVIFSTLFFSVSVYPCGCPGSTSKPTETQRLQMLTDQIDRAEVIFSGKVIRKDTYSVEFEVNASWKGEVSDKFTMSTGIILINENMAKGDGCSFSFAKDHSYLVFAQYLDLEYTNGKKLLGGFLCGKTTDIQYAEETISDLDHLRQAEKRNYEKNSGQTYTDLIPSSIDDDLTAYKRANPDGSDIDLAGYANTQLSKTGMNYRFDICEMLPEGDPQIEPDSYFAKFKLPFTTIDLKTQIYQIRSGFGNSPCGECFTGFPTAQITGKEVVTVVGGKKVRLKRPEHFMLDKMHLVDKSLKNVIRTWELPFSTIPEGVSLDGTKLYVEYYIPEIEDSGLLLELAEDGTVKFAAKDSIKIADKSEDLEDFPKEDGNDYLSYKKFTHGGNSFFIKYSFPCT